MNALTEDYAKTYAELQWCLNILERIAEVLAKEELTENDRKTLKWLVKQGQKCHRED